MGKGEIFESGLIDYNDPRWRSEREKLEAAEAERTREQEAEFLKWLPSCSNRELLDATLELAAGDYYDGDFTRLGEWKFEKMKLELFNRLGYWVDQPRPLKESLQLWKEIDEFCSGCSKQRPVSEWCRIKNPKACSIVKKRFGKRIVGDQRDEYIVRM